MCRPTSCRAFRGVNPKLNLCPPARRGPPHSSPPNTGIHTIHSSPTQPSSPSPVYPSFAPANADLFSWSPDVIPRARISTLHTSSRPSGLVSLPLLLPSPRILSTLLDLQIFCAGPQASADERQTRSGGHTRPPVTSRPFLTRFPPFSLLPSNLGAADRIRYPGRATRDQSGDKGRSSLGLDLRYLSGHLPSDRPRHLLKGLNRRSTPRPIPLTETPS